MAEEGSTREALEAAFASDDGHEPETIKAPEAEAETSVADNQDNQDRAKPAQETPQEPEIPAPASYRQEAKEFWKSVPRQLQQEIAKREQDRERAYHRATRQFKHLQEVDEIFAPMADQLAVQGKSPAQVVKQWMAFDKLYEADPIGTAEQILSAKGLTLDDLVRSVQERGESATNPKLSAVEKELQEMKSWREQLEHGQANQAHAYMVDEISAFGSEVGTDGKAARPHFEQLLPSIVPIAEQIKAENPRMNHRAVLESAYNQARESLKPVFESDLAVSNAKKLDERKQAAVKARSAAVSVSGGPGAASARTNPQSTREMLEAAWADQGY